MRSAPIRRSGADVAAGVLAATLLLTPGCDLRVEERAAREAAAVTAASSPAGNSVRGEASGRVGGERPPRLATHWLIPPAVDQDPPLAVPVALAVDGSSERLFLLELRPPEVRVYSALDGAFVARFGREGGGPGELQAPMSMAWSPGNGLAVVGIDGRTTFLSTEGVPAGVGRVGNGLATRIMTARADSFLVKIDRLPPADVSEYHVVAFGEGSSGIRFTDDAVSDLEDPARPLRNHAYAVTGNGAGELLLAPPGPVYRILRISPRGVPAQEIRRPEIPPLVRSEEEMAELRSEVRRGFHATGRSAPGDFAVPRHRSHIATLVIASDGEIWALTKRGNDRLSIIDRFDPRGRFLTSYEVPLQIIDFALSDRRVYLLGLDDRGLPGVATAPRPDVRDVTSEGTGGDR